MYQKKISLRKFKTMISLQILKTKTTHTTLKSIKNYTKNLKNWKKKEPKNKNTAL